MCIVDQGACIRVCLELWSWIKGKLDSGISPMILLRELWMWLYISLVRDELYRAVRFLAPEAFAMVSREGER